MVSRIFLAAYQWIVSKFGKRYLAGVPTDFSISYTLIGKIKLVVSIIFKLIGL